MGDKIKGAAVGGLGGAQGAALGGAFGLNGMGKALGLSGEQGDYSHASNPALDMMNERNAAANSGTASDAVRTYGNEGSSLGDTLKWAQGNGGLNGDQMSALTNRLATDPMSGTKFATEQVQGNPILGQLFGKGGQLENTIATGNRLQNQGYALTPEDHEAYGQASGDIARMFGQSESNLSQSLADRGLAGGSNGAAGVGFSGLQGNKNEMLAKAQTDIADKRMQNTMARIGQNNSLLSSLSGQANTAINDQYGRQLAGVNSANGQLSDAAKTSVGQEGANLASMEDQRGAKGKTLLEGLGSGLYQSSDMIGQIPGKTAQSAAGGGVPSGAAGRAAPTGAGPTNTYGSGPGLGYNGNYGI